MTIRKVDVIIKEERKCERALIELAPSLVSFCLAKGDWNCQKCNLNHLFNRWAELGVLLGYMLGEGAAVHLSFTSLLSYHM